MSVDNEIFEALACDAHADAANLLAAGFDLDLTRMVYEDAVVAVGDVEWNTLVCLLAGSAAIPVPDADGLPCHTRTSAEASITWTDRTVLHKRSKLLSKRKVPVNPNHSTQLALPVPSWKSLKHRTVHHKKIIRLQTYHTFEESAF